jgi:hypothetical protein
VCTSRSVDEREGDAEVLGNRVLCSEQVLPSADVDGSVAAGGADELLDRPSGAVLDEPADREGGEHDRQVRLDRLAFVVVERAARSCLDIRNECSIWNTRW